MALKGDRLEFLTDISFFNNNTVAVRGGIACIVSAGSGSALDQSAAQVGYIANSSGQQPVGLLLNDVVNLDMTRQHINWHHNEVQVGGKVTLCKKGFLVTNFIAGTPAFGDFAHLASSGFVMNVSVANSVTVNRIANPKVGVFHSTLDEDGYAKIYIDL